MVTKYLEIEKTTSTIYLAQFRIISIDFLTMYVLVSSKFILATRGSKIEERGCKIRQMETAQNTTAKMATVIIYSFTFIYCRSWVFGATYRFVVIM